MNLFALTILKPMLNTQKHRITSYNVCYTKLLRLVIVAILIIGENILGINVTALLAGAGIFGLAVAFARNNFV